MGTVNIIYTIKYTHTRHICIYKKKNDKRNDRESFRVHYDNILLTYTINLPKNIMFANIAYIFYFIPTIPMQYDFIGLESALILINISISRSRVLCITEQMSESIP